MGDRDVVYDFDRLKKAMTKIDTHERADYIMSLLLALRGSFLRNIKDNDEIETAYVIVTNLSEQFKSFIKNDIGIEAEYRFMEATLDECLARLDKDDTRPDKKTEEEKIREWFRKKEGGTMEKKLAERQYRATFDVGAKESEKRIESTHYIEGYATTFEPYVLYEDSDGPVYESFTKKCFENTDMSDIIMQFDHTGKVFARNSNKTLIVEPTDKGLFIAADLSKSEAARELYTEIQEGLLTKMSWGFRLGEYGYDKKTRTIKHESVKKIYDVSAVSIPANNDTSINARSFVNGEILKAVEEDQKREKLKLQIKLELERG